MNGGVIVINEQYEKLVQDFEQSLQRDLKQNEQEFLMWLANKIMHDASRL